MAPRYGTRPDAAAKRLDEWGADVIGLNCSVGPHGMLAASSRWRWLTTRPLSAQPNAGLPREIHGRKMYMASPEYMAKFTGRLIRAGAKFVGGCCGTTPEHIARMADAVHAIAPRPGHVSVAVDRAGGRAAARAEAAGGAVELGREDRGGRAGHHRRDRAAEGHHAGDRMLAGVRLLKRRASTR
jgi:hypothetical protein